MRSDIIKGFQICSSEKSTDCSSHQNINHEDFYPKIKEAIHQTSHVSAFMKTFLHPSKIQRHDVEV